VAQVRICYGAYSNRTLLQRYGFTLLDNPHDSLAVKLCIGSEDAALSSYHRLWPSGRLSKALWGAMRSSIETTPERSVGGSSGGGGAEHDRDSLVVGRCLLEGMLGRCVHIW